MDEKRNVLLIATLDSKEIETAFLRERLEENGLEVYMMCEIPSNVIMTGEFSEIFDGFSIRLSRGYEYCRNASIF